MISRRIDLWFIDKIAILVEMEAGAEVRSTLTEDLLRRGEAPWNFRTYLIGALSRQETRKSDPRHASR